MIFVAFIILLYYRNSLSSNALILSEFSLNEIIDSAIEHFVPLLDLMFRYDSMIYIS